MKFWIIYLAVIFVVGLFGCAIPSLMSARSDVAVCAAAAIVVALVGLLGQTVYEQAIKHNDDKKGDSK